MLWKTLVGIGALTIILSFLGTIFGIYRSFAGIQNAEAEGLSPVISDIETATFSNTFGIIGFIILIVGLFLFYKQRKV